MALAALAERQLMAAPGGSQTSLDATLIKQHAGPVPVQRRVVVDIPARAAAAKALAAGATPKQPLQWGPQPVQPWQLLSSECLLYLV